MSPKPRAPRRLSVEEITEELLDLDSVDLSAVDEGWIVDYVCLMLTRQGKLAQPNDVRAALPDAIRRQYEANLREERLRVARRPYETE